MSAIAPPATRFPHDLPGWTALFLGAEIPVLAETAATLEALRPREDDVDANMLGEIIAVDPLMTLKVMSCVAAGASRRVTDAETVTAALVLLGITPFFRTFQALPTVEDRLREQPQALTGLQAVMGRAHRAAKFALAFAVHRMDHDAAVIHQAALLHDFAEMLLWCHAPSAALEIAQRQKAQPGLRSAQAQRDVLGIELLDLQLALMRAWRLPELLIRMNDDRHAGAAQVRNVHLAIRVARHSAQGWDNAALPDDVSELSALLTLGIEPTWTLLRDIDAG